jgi:hypothetical protein
MQFLIPVDSDPNRLVRRTGLVFGRERFRKKNNLLNETSPFCFGILQSVPRVSRASHHLTILAEET